jgi:hypothetical protein
LTEPQPSTLDTTKNKGVRHTHGNKRAHSQTQENVDEDDEDADTEETEEDCCGCGYDHGDAEQENGADDILDDGAWLDIEEQVKDAFNSTSLRGPITKNASSDPAANTPDDEDDLFLSDSEYFASILPESNPAAMNGVFLQVQDIPDIANLFSSMYPSEDHRFNGQLSIVVPTPQMYGAFSGGAAEYFSPAGPSIGNAATATMFLGANHLSPAPKMANPSNVANNTMRKLTYSYGVPIAPLQRAFPLEIKPKVIVAPTSMSNGTASGGPNKASRLSVTPDISDFKLVQIFHNFCDPVSNLLSLNKFHQLLQQHHVKEDNHHASNNASSSTPSTETQAIFKVLDPNGLGVIDLEKFMSSFQICNRCTEAKRRTQSAFSVSQGQTFVTNALDRQLMDDISPVIVRVAPTTYEGLKVKGCEHYQWTWCEGFEKTGNEKCRGTNRHDKCPKYLANCTLWKHKLPPKNRKATKTAGAAAAAPHSAPGIALSLEMHNVDSPSKKFKHFA